MARSLLRKKELETRNLNNLHIMIGDGHAAAVKGASTPRQSIPWLLLTATALLLRSCCTAFAPPRDHRHPLHGARLGRLESTPTDDRVKIGLESDNVSDKGGSARIRSHRRMEKARRLLEMAQVSPSQRLEMEEREQMAFDRRLRGGVTAAAAVSFPSSSNSNSQDDVFQMRMAGTFDSVDNLVDSKSLLPGGRWVVEDSRDTATTGETSSNASFSEMDVRNKLAVTGQVAEVSVCVCCSLYV